MIDAVIDRLDAEDLRWLTSLRMAAHDRLLAGAPVVLDADGPDLDHLRH